MKHTKRSGFTLVELIVVIAVLAVLATISFSAVSNITSSARDSSRLTDVSSMKTALETYSATKGALPVPDNVTNITWSGALVWSQGTFGDNTTRQLGNISKPKDPKWSNEYTYSLANNKREYELATVLEKATSLSSFNKVYAAGESYEPTIKGNYNGVAIKTQSGSSIWILSVPTIIAGDINDAKIEHVTLSFSKSGNLPASYVGKIVSSQSAVTFTGITQVWSGSDVPKTDSDYITLTTNLKNAYSGSFLAATNNSIKSLLATSGSTATALYGGSLVNAITAAKASYSTTNATNNSGGWNVSTDPYAGSVVSLLRFDNNLLDSTGKTWTSVGGATTSNEQIKIWLASGYIGTTGYFYTPYSTDFNIGTSNFTIDAWVYITNNAQYNYIASKWNCSSTADDYIFNTSDSGKLEFHIWTYDPVWPVLSTASAVPSNTWTHVAVVRSGSTFYLFINGWLSATVVNNTAPRDSNLPLEIWAYSEANCAVKTHFAGYLDEFRFTKGVARWTSTFTPPTASDY